MPELYPDDNEVVDVSNLKLTEFQGYLDAHAHHALACTSSERTDEMASTVADIASVLAADSLRREGATVDSLALRAAFYDAAARAGEAFAPVFNADGTQVLANEKQYKAAMKALRPIAHRHLEAAFKAAGIEDVGNPQTYMAKLTFADAMRYAAQQLGTESTIAALHAQFSTDEGIKQALHQVFAGDAFEKNIEDISLVENDMRNNERQAFGLVVRMANATWMAGEAQKAAWEGKDTRIDHNQRNEFNPYDLFLRLDADAQYNSSIAAGLTPEQASAHALLRAAYDVYKDVKPSSERIKDDERLVPVDYQLHGHKHDHVKARTEASAGYNRAYVPDDATWESYMPTYDSDKYPEYTAPVVLGHDRSKAPKGVVDPEKYWADPVDITQSVNYPDFESYEGKILLDKDGYPLNPMGPTGTKGRGVLGKWGRNLAIDDFTSVDDQDYFKGLFVKRKSGQWALVGGMVDDGEEDIVAANREMKEETSLSLDMSRAQDVYMGYVDDPRNTDNAWMETHARHLHLDHIPAERPSAQNDPDGTTLDAEWLTVTDELLDGLFASHADIVRRAIGQWQERTGTVVRNDGKIGIAA